MVHYFCDTQVNQLTSLSGGGNLADLGLLIVLDLHSNHLSSLPEDIKYLCNLKVFNTVEFKY